VAFLLGLNLLVLAAAYPETMAVDSGCCASQSLARDFSAYYTAAWRLLNDPSQVYTHGYLNDGEYHILPQPEGYKYLPSFLITISPLLLMPYQKALWSFDVFQFLLLPLVAWLIYKLVKDRGLAITAVVTVAVLLLPLPLPTPNWSLSASYYWQWAEGQSKVLATFMLLSALYLAKIGRPRLSGVVFAFASFDPRFALLAFPLFATYNTRLRSAVVYWLGTFAAINAPLLWPPTGLGFLEMVFGSGVITPPYYYTFIPIVALSSLLLLDRERVGETMKRVFTQWSAAAYPGGQKSP
jgi:hypothetical protein